MEDDFKKSLMSQGQYITRHFTEHQLAAYLFFLMQAVSLTSDPKFLHDITLMMGEHMQHIMGKSLEELILLFTTKEVIQ